jgi:hypothetical protein
MDSNLRGNDAQILSRLFAVASDKFAIDNSIQATVFWIMLLALSLGWNWHHLVQSLTGLAESEAMPRSRRT